MLREGPMTPRFDGYFQSGRQRREEWHAGVLMVDEYYEYLKLYEDGRWLRKWHPTPDLDFASYLSGITDETFREGEAGRDPYDRELGEEVHVTGRFTRVGDELEFVSRVFLAIMHERRWKFRVVSTELLVSDRGAEYIFRPTAGAA